MLDRASALQCLLFTHDDDLLGEAALRQATNLPFSGLIYAHQLALTVGQAIEDLEVIAKASDPEDWADSVIYLPL